MSLRNPTAGKLLCSLVIATILSLSAGCDFITPLPKINKPFDSAEIHQPDEIAPDDNVIFLTPGADIEFRAQQAVLAAKPGTTIVFPAGVHGFSDELVVNTSHITLAGMGMDKTILDFSKQQSGAQGILAYGNQFTVQDLAVLDSAGDGIRAEGVNGVTFRRIHVEWTKGTDENNGAYGIYPIMSNNVLVEDSIVRAASDAGIYVGQSQNIIVRRNTVEYNVAGIEIENSTYADVYDNWTSWNTAGILVFDLPNLVRQGGQSVRIFDNVLFENDTPNFAPAGNIVGLVPSGTGIMIMANDDIEVFNNRIRNHGTASVGVVSYLVAGLPLDDPNYDPIPERIYIHDNLLERPIAGRYVDGSDLSLLINLLAYPKKPGEIVYDGIGETAFGGTSLPESRKLCFRSNKTHRPLIKKVRFTNLNLQNEKGPLAILGLPGGPVSTDKAPHDCSYPPLPAVVLDDPLPLPDTDNDYTDEQIAAICNTPTEGVNWAAFEVNCPNLASYNLFADRSDALSAPTSNGVIYDLTAPLFTDYAKKRRTLYIPEGFQINYSETDLDYPIGTIISKTFYYPADFRDASSANDVIETRLLIRRANKWARIPYIWKKGVATMQVGGGHRTVNWVDETGTQQSTVYAIPNANQCSSCHGPRQTDKPLGPKAARLNLQRLYGEQAQNQLKYWEATGILAGLPNDFHHVPRHPVWHDDTDGTLEQRARGYLEGNCAHCHSESGRAATTGLWLTADRALDRQAGICKPPIAAGAATGGLQFDIVPGKAAESILVYRLNSALPAIKMPELGKSVVHAEGVALVSEWINSLSGSCATEATGDTTQVAETASRITVSDMKAAGLSDIDIDAVEKAQSTQ